MSVYRIARSTLAHRLRPVCRLGARVFSLPQEIRTQKYSTSESTPRLNDLATQVTQWEKSFNTRIESGFKKLKDELISLTTESSKSSNARMDNGFRKLNDELLSCNTRMQNGLKMSESSLARVDERMTKADNRVFKGMCVMGVLAYFAFLFGLHERRERMWMEGDIKRMKKAMRRIEKRSSL